MLEDKKQKFIRQHQKCLDRFTVILSEFDVNISGMDDLDRIDPNQLPAFHKFVAWRELCGERVAMPVGITPEEIDFQSFDAIIPRWADLVRENLRPVAVD